MPQSHEMAQITKHFYLHEIRGWGNSHITGKECKEDHECQKVDVVEDPAKCPPFVA